MVKEGRKEGRQLFNPKNLNFLLVLIWSLEFSIIKNRQKPESENTSYDKTSPGNKSKYLPDA